MADKKITELTSLTTPTGEDLLVVVDNPTGTPVSKKISLKTLFGAITSNVVSSGVNNSFSGNTAFNGDKTNVSGTLVLSTKKTVSSNNATTQFGVNGMGGAIFWDDNYLYVATSNTVIKRVALSTFSL